MINSDINVHFDGENLPLELRFTLRSTEIYQVIATFLRKWTGIIGKSLFLIAFSPILILGYFLAKRAYIKLDLLVEKYKVDFEKDINSLELRQVKVEELELKKIHGIIASLATDLESDHRIIKPFSESVFSINNNLKFLIELCQSKIRYSKDEFFSSKAEFDAFQDAFAELADVWNYETTEEEQQFVFSSRQKMSK